MMQAIARRASMGRLIAFLVTTVFAAGLAHSQTRLKVNVPYPFTVASEKLPGGDYTFTVDEFRVVVQSSRDQASVNIVSQLNGPNVVLQGGSLIFDKTADGKLILSELWMPGGSGVLLHSPAKGDARTVLEFDDLSQIAHPSGKTAYRMACARCHGENGDGNKEADKFFNISIPRLNSAEVQSKSDAEIKDIILHGTSIMPPVEVDEAGFHHRLPPQDLDVVVAYIRTLKPS